MNRRTYFLTALLMTLSLTALSSCIDNKYRIDEIDKEVHFAPGGASFPLGYIEQKKLGQIIGDKISTISVQDGYYVLRHTGTIGYTIDKINVEDIVFSNLNNFFGGGIKVNPQGDGNQLPGTIDIDGRSVVIPHDIPSFDMSGDTEIELLNLNKTGGIPTGLSGTVGAGETFSGSFLSGEDATIEIDVALPKEVKSVQTVWLKDADNTSSNKATVKVALDLGGLADVTQSININYFNVILPDNYKILPGPYGSVSQSVNHAFEATNINMGSGSYEFEFYIEQIDMSGITPDAANNLKQTGNFIYDIDYTLTTKAGTVGSGNPSVAITGKPEFRDARFTTNVIDFGFEADPPFDFSQTITGIGDVVESVSYVAFESGNTLTVTMDDPGLPDAFLNELPIVITFPAAFDIASVQGLTDNVLTVKASQLVNGYDLTLNGINFTGDAAIPVNGNLTVAGAIEVNADHRFAGTTFLWSDDIADKTVPEVIKVGIGDMENLVIDYSESRYKLNAVSQDVEASGKFDESFDLPGLIKNISQVIIAKAADGTGAEVEMTLSVTIDNWFDGINEFYLDDFTIRLPSLLMIDAGEFTKQGEAFNPQTNVYTNECITVTKPATGNEIELVSFKVQGLKGIALDDGKAIIKGDLEFSATARTPSGTTINPEDGEMTIKPKIEISDIAVTGLSGMFDLDLEDYIDDDDIKPIDFSDLFEYLSENENQRPNLAAPVLTLDIENPLGINFLGNVTLDPKNADGESLCDNVITFDEGFRINPASAAQQTITRLYITDDGEDNCPGGYVGYDLKLSDLVNVIPHTVDIGLSGTVNPDQSLINSILLGDEDYKFSMDYTIEVPLSFGPDMDMELEFDVKDLNETFTKLADQKVKAAEIAVFAGFTVTFPLVIDDVKVEFTDKDGDPIDGLATTVSGSITGPAKAGDEPRESILAIGLTVPKGGDFTTLSEIDIMKITIPISSADSSENAENQLSPDDTIEGRVWFQLAKGVSVNLGDL